jgi:hypothetical protein
VKTTLEIPDPIFRRAQSVAAQRGIPLRAWGDYPGFDCRAYDPLQLASLGWPRSFGPLLCLALAKELL